ARMELGSRQSQLAHRALHLGDGLITLVWVHTGKAYELMRVALHNLRYGVVLEWLLPCCCLGVPGQQHRHNILLGIVVCNLFDIAQLDLQSEELLGGGAILTDSYVHELRDGQMYMEIDCPWHAG